MSPLLVIQKPLQRLDVLFRRILRLLKKKKLLRLFFVILLIVSVGVVIGIGAFLDALVYQKKNPARLNVYLATNSASREPSSKTANRSSSANEHDSDFGVHLRARFERKAGLGADPNALLAQAAYEVSSENRNDHDDRFLDFDSGIEESDDSDMLVNRMLLTEKETELIRHYMSPTRSKKFLEWGSGRTSMFFGVNYSRSSVSIEYDPMQCEFSRQQIYESAKEFVQAAAFASQPKEGGVAEGEEQLFEDTNRKGSVEAQNLRYEEVPVDGVPDGFDFRVLHFRLLCIPVRLGTRGWNHSLWEGDFSQFRQYVNAVDTLESSFDVVLVHGKARLACAAKALTWLKPNSVLIMADYFSRETLYERMLRYYEPIDSIDRLLVLRRRLNVSDNILPLSDDELQDLYTDLPNVHSWGVHKVRT